MKRYTQANREIRLPADLAARTVEAGGRKTSPLRAAALTAAAVLLLAAVGGVAVWQLKGDAPLPPIVDDTTTALDTTATPGTTAAPVTTPAPETTEPAGPTQTSDVPLQFQLAKAVYPTAVAYPKSTDYDRPGGTFDTAGYQAAYDAWIDDRSARRNQPAGYDAGLDASCIALMRQFLTSDAETAGENRVLSPVNVYMALSMLTELTDGQSRAQILSLLGADSVETVRGRAKHVWEANYQNDGLTTTVFGSSLWLSDRFSFRQSTLDTLAEHYYASSFRGTVGSAEFDAALRSWLDEQTGGLLREQVNNFSLDPRTVLALATTVHYQAKWQDEFFAKHTAQGLFHAAAGDETADFMHQSSVGDYYWGDGFGAVAKSLRGSGMMWLILPDEGVSTDSLLAGNAIYNLALNGYGAEKKTLVVNLSMPKFDVSSELDLKAGLASLGITDVFDPATADFSPVSEEQIADELFVSQAEHAVRVAVDEEGCTAAAYTVMVEAGAGAPPKDEVDFVLDRPFIFVVTSGTGAPLFAGVVETVG